MELTLNEYAKEICLHEVYRPVYTPLSEKERTEIINALLNELRAVSMQLEGIKANTIEEKRKLLHATLNILKPSTLSQEGINLLNTLLQSELNQAGLTKAASTVTKACVNGTDMSIYQGDITKLQCDAIVNAANSQLLGCFQPLHSCIDNAIHSKAGVQLRDDCQLIIKKQGALEATGKAKITRGYNLPSNFVIHTVGPIVQGNLNNKHQEDLRQSYMHCLDLCKALPIIKSIAFCCISTGVFGYPQKEAAQVAYKTVCEWLSNNPLSVEKVIFNVFTDNDFTIYNTLINR